MFRHGTPFVLNTVADTPLFMPNKASLAESFRFYEHDFQVLLTRLHEYLETVIKLKSPPSFRLRVKSFDSYYKKLLKYPPKCALDDLPTTITDIIAIRVVCSFLSDVASVEKAIQEHFDVVEVEKKGSARTVIEFGYESIHVLVNIPEHLKQGLSLPKGLVFEIQIRTILQDAWAEVEHELVYKAEFSPFDNPLKRKMAAINASLTLADITFQEIRDYQTKLNIELEKRRTQFYSTADEFSATFLDGLNVSSTPKSPEPVEEKSANMDPTSIDDLILHAISAHNAGEFEKAEKFYTQIIDKTENNVILSVIFKHRGMAFFAQGKYELSLSDFMQSIQYDDSNFRAHYYVAIALTLLDRHKEALEYFTRSLELNPYQAHVHFRRGLAYFHEEAFVEALNDLDIARSLGYDGADAQRLRVEISKKMQMV